MATQPVLSPGWHHYFIGAPLSPKAKVTLSRALKHFSDQDRDLEILPAQALILPLLDLGVLHESREKLLIEAVESTLASFSSIKLQATGWRTQPSLPEKPSSQEGYLWLAWNERLGVLRSVIAGLKRAFTLQNFDAEEVSAWRGDITKKSSDEIAVLCARYSRCNSDIYAQPFRCNAWINSISLQKRPSHFLPSSGYQSAWRYELPLETPAFTEMPSSIFHDEEAKAASVGVTGLNERQAALYQELEQKLESASPLSTKTSTNRKQRPRGRTKQTRTKRRAKAQE